MKKQLRALYALHSIDLFASFLVGIMVPIYFISLGFSLVQIFTYFIVLSVSIVLAFFLAGYFATFLGLKACLIARLIFQFIRLAFLFYLPSSPWLLFPIALANGLQVAFYWFPVHVIFSQSSTNKGLGKEVGKFNAYSKIGAVIAPLTGALISASLGFKYLFLSGAVIFLITIIPLSLLTSRLSRINFHPSVILGMLKKYRRLFAGMIVQSFSAEAEGVLLPIFIFLTFGSIISAGSIGTFAGLGGILFTLFVGLMADQYSRKNLLKWGAVIMSLIWLIRYFYANEISYYVLSIVAGFITILISIPFDTIGYNVAKSENIDEFIVFREIPIALGRLLIYSLALAITLKINYSFLMAAIAHIYYLFL